MSNSARAWIRNHQDRLPEILELDLRELSAGPQQRELLNLTPSDRLQQSIQELTEMSGRVVWTIAKRSGSGANFWSTRIPKTKACLKLGIRPVWMAEIPKPPGRGPKAGEESL